MEDATSSTSKERRICAHYPSEFGVVVLVRVAEFLASGCREDLERVRGTVIILVFRALTPSASQLSAVRKS